MRSLTRALVVGGAGFFGRWLVDALLEREIEAVVLDELSTHRHEEVRASELIEADVTRIDVSAVLDDRQIDVVFQLAGSASVPRSIETPIQDMHQNVLTTLTVLEGARTARSAPLVAFVSSAAVYGEGETMPMTEDHPVRPVSPYGVAKLAAESYVTLYARLHGIAAFSVRPFSLYGPGQRKQVVYDLMSRVVDGEDPLTVLGSPDVSRDFIFVEDAARALVAIARGAPASGEVYNIATGRPTTLGELVNALLAATGRDTSVRFTGHVRVGDPLHWEGDPRRAQALGAHLDTPLDEGLRRTVEWFMGSDEVAA